MTQAWQTEHHDPSEPSLTARRPLSQTEPSRPRLAKTLASTFQPPPLATSTEARTPVETWQAEREQVLSEVPGIVLGEAGDSTLVRLENQSVTVHFPNDLISEDLLPPGTGVTYQIVRRPNGMRYQRFVARQLQVDAERVAEVIDVLATIRLRGK